MTPDEYHIKIQQLIFTGLENACKKTKDYAQEENMIIPAEYLLTVNVADSIFPEIQEDYFKLLLEFDTKTLADINYQDLGGEIFDMCINDVRNTNRNGNVDIAIINGNNAAFTCIELKRFNPTKSVIYKDVKRLSELVNRKSKTGESKILMNYLAFVYGNNSKCDDTSFLSKYAKKYYEDILQTLNIEFSSLNDSEHFSFKYEVLTQSISHINKKQHDPDSGEDISHHYLGIVIIIKPQ
jgi:hypothetical protein